MLRKVKQKTLKKGNYKKKKTLYKSKTYFRKDYKRNYKKTLRGNVKGHKN